MIENINLYYSLKDIPEPFRNESNLNNTSTKSSMLDGGDDLFFTLLLMLLVFDDNNEFLDSPYLRMLLNL